MFEQRAKDSKCRGHCEPQVGIAESWRNGRAAADFAKLLRPMFEELADLSARHVAAKLTSAASSPPLAAVCMRRR